MDARTAVIEQPPQPVTGSVRNQGAPWADGLTTKEAAFVEHWQKWRNATQAYTHAYDTDGSYETRRNGGHEVLSRPRVREAIKLRQKIATEASSVDVAWLLDWFVSIATADPRELIGLKIGCCRFCYGEGHGYQWREAEYLEELAKVEREQARLAKLGQDVSDLLLPDIGGGFGFNATWTPHPGCPRCHGEGVERFVPRDTDKLSDQALLLYGGVKVKADGGYEIVIADRAKAAELAGRIMGAFNDKLRISGAVAHMHTVADLRKVDPQEASKAYREMIAGHLATG